MRVAVDRERCAGHAQCSVICPEVFDSDESGYAVLRREGSVPEGEESSAEEAIRSCPEQAIFEVHE
jgi:ferredoxin